MPGRILVVDDDATIRRFLTRLLTRHDYVVDEVEDGRQALSLFRRQEYDVLLTDLCMPGMDGFELIDRTRDIPIPKIVLTGMGTVQDALEAVHHGAYDFVEKPIRDLDGFLLTIRRAMEMKALLRRTRETEDRLARAEQMSALGQMAASVAHEIRNPLVSIGGYANRILKKLGDDSPCADYARIIADETLRLERIVRDVLDFANLGRPTLQETRVADCFRNAARLLTPQVRKKRVTLVDELEQQTLIYADGNQMEQIFINLIQNSLDAMPRGGEIRVRDQVAEDCVQVRFSDTGHGIPKDMPLSQLFDPFHTTKPNGVGLGLAITRRIMQTHEGRVEIEETGPGGTTFLLTFPRWNASTETVQATGLPGSNGT